MWYLTISHLKFTTLFMAYNVGYTDNKLLTLKAPKILLWVHTIYKPILYMIGGLRNKW